MTIFESTLIHCRTHARTGRIINVLYLAIKDLLNNLFEHPYTKIEFIEKGLGVSRITAAKYSTLGFREH